MTISSPADAISAQIGISMVPEDRKGEGLFLDLDGRENIALPSLGRFTRWGFVHSTAEEASVRSMLDLVQVVPRALWSLVREFSGGNQQKIVFAKWLLAGSRILLLYDPTRGVDVGTKAEIYHLVREFAEAGGAVLYYSTDIPELVNLCDEVAVIYRGRIADMLADDCHFGDQDHGCGGRSVGAQRACCGISHGGIDRRRAPGHPLFAARLVGEVARHAGGGWRVLSWRSSSSNW